MNQNNTNTDIDPHLIPDDLPTDEERSIIEEAFLHRHNPVPDVDSQWLRFCDAVAEDSPARNRKFAWWIGIAVAACAALLVVMFAGHDDRHDNGIEVMASIDNAADVTMSCSDGERVVKDKSISFVRCSRPASQIIDASTVTMTTPRGRECTMTLSDGTKVWLGGESTIEFPRQFLGRERRVKMSGEAYFEVAKDARHPFVVATDYFSTTVLGTSFNVRAYSPSDASVSLVEGKVSMMGENLPRQILRPGQRAQYHADGFRVEAIDTYPVLQRRDGYFYFDNESLLKVMIELGRWYNKTVVFDNEASMHERLHFVAERKQPLDEVVGALNEMDGICVEVSDAEIVVH